MFDLDGTLADTLDDIADAGNSAMRGLGRPEFSRDRYRYLAGQGLEQLMIDALGSDHRHLVPRGMQLFREHYAAHAVNSTRSYAGIPELLDQLTDRGFRLAVFSNKPDPATREVVARSFSRWSFDRVVGARPNVPLKPDPTGAIEIARDLNIEPSRWLYLGDTRVDMLTARAAGMFAVGVLWGFRDEPELRESGANAIIREPGQLLDLLQQPAHR